MLVLEDLPKQAPLPGRGLELTVRMMTYTPVLLRISLMHHPVRPIIQLDVGIVHDDPAAVRD